jgi:uncharacterized protein
MRVERRGQMTVAVDVNVPAHMRDGVTLRANVYRPDGRGPWPTLLARTPYGKDSPFLLMLLDPVRAARDGFMVVVQDTRGRFESEGEWTPFRHERLDGYDSVEWAARLPGCNGRVGMYGDSYLGSTQWMAAVEQPPSLAAISPSLTWSDPLDGLFARGGALELGLALPWTLSTGASHLARSSASTSEGSQQLGMLIDDLDALAGQGYWGLPTAEMPVLGRHAIPDIGTFAMLRDATVPSWCRVRGQHHRVSVPTFNTAGWYDIFLQGTLDNYSAMASLGRSACLVVGPWTHGAWVDPVGQQCYGFRANRIGALPDAEMTGRQLDWFRSHLLPTATPVTETAEAPVRIFVMGRNMWRPERSWPLARARVERWFLRSGGTLSPGPPDDDEAVTEYLYDPSDPTPTIGGQTVMSPAFPAGPFDQRPIEVRDDVRVFTSDPLPADLEVTGRVRAVLHAESSAPSTDWVARLCDVNPDGRSFNLCDGIVRIAEHADICRQVEIDLWSTSNVFLAGHRVRLHITSSSFPRWDRNLNSGDQSTARIETARQRVHHGRERASWIELPIVS